MKEIIFYLVQHGEAKSKEEDPERHLTEKGKEDTEKVAKFLKKANVKPRKIIHSGKTRAKETAEIYAEFLKPEEGTSEEKNLAPLDAPCFWAKKLKEFDESIMIVGHLPHLSKLVSLLLTDNSEVEIVKFTYSGCLALAKQEERFYIKWYVTPGVCER